MIVNSTMTTTSVPAVASSSPVGLTIGLILVFLLVGIVAGVVVYKYHSKIRNMVQSRQRRSQKKEDYAETAQDDSHQYTGMIREQPTAQTPIYENLTTRTHGYSRSAESQSRSPGEPEEDLYLQCDLPDDAIYSNDPKCNLAIHPNTHEEDVYIMPDS